MTERTVSLGESEFDEGALIVSFQKTKIKIKKEKQLAKATKRVA